MYNGSQLSSVAGTPRDPTWCSSEESSSEEVYHRSSSSEEVYPDGDECPPSNIRTPLGNITNTPNTQSIIPEWDGCNPDSVVKSLKVLDKDQLKELGIREFYKSYGSWEKMSIEQRKKVVSYFRALPDEIQELVILEAQQDTVAAAQSKKSRNTQTSKDDIIHLILLFKEPSVQQHWTNLHGIMKRAELDAHRAPPAYAEGANPLSYLAEVFNDYEGFTPQNLMVEYMSPGVNLPPVKKNPYQANANEQSYLATFTHDLKPTNAAHKDIIRGEDWIKSTWTDCRKYLHQMYINYNRSGQHDDDKDEWGSEKELRHWSKAVKWNPSNAGSIICCTSSMIYSIDVLDICNFEAIGCKMPKDTGVDATMDNGTVVGEHKKRKRKTKTSTSNGADIVRAFEQSEEREDKRYALRMLLEYLE